MRDSVRLATDVHFPSSTSGPWPVILVRTPYNRDMKDVEDFVPLLLNIIFQGGYALVMQDSRGRYDSEGIDSLYFCDGWGKMQDGYDTVIGEDGAGLSGGQLQRIVIARAILKNPAILIFDEATSQIDADSEAKIHKAIEEIMQGRTTFIIAHRFSTVISADVIVVMDGGRIIAEGQHEELMEKKE